MRTQSTIQPISKFRAFLRAVSVFVALVYFFVLIVRVLNIAILFLRTGCGLKAIVTGENSAGVKWCCLLPAALIILFQTELLSYNQESTPSI